MRGQAQACVQVYLAKTFVDIMELYQIIKELLRTLVNLFLKKG
jgi:hypothetical protein